MDMNTLHKQLEEIELEEIDRFCSEISYLCEDSYFVCFGLKWVW